MASQNSVCILQVIKPPPKPKKKVLCFVKVSKVALTPENIGKEVGIQIHAYDRSRT
jgi:hypothetical protein